MKRYWFGLSACCLTVAAALLLAWVSREREDGDSWGG